MVRCAVVLDFPVRCCRPDLLREADHPCSYVPETRILSLEQLDIVFNQPASSFRKFAYKDANWLFRRYLRRHKNMEDRPKFYEEIHEESEREGTEMQRMRNHSTSIEESNPRRPVSRKAQTADSPVQPVEGSCSEEPGDILDIHWNF